MKRSMPCKAGLNCNAEDIRSLLHLIQTKTFAVMLNTDFLRKLFLNISKEKSILMKVGTNTVSAKHPRDNVA